MAKMLIKYLRFPTLLWTLLILNGNNSQAQTYPDIPASVSFGGITVKFDRSAQNLIEEDVKSLMSNKKFWEEKMDRAILHFPIVESILMDEEVPIDFKYLAVQESSFKPEVVSSSNAVGYWQFKPETARELNLRVDKDVDERKNLSSSTHGAAWYLKRSNQQFNNWVSTLYSYYLGAGAVKKTVPANWAYAREVTLTGKTDRYMLRFFAHKIALEAGIEKHRTNNPIVLFESEYGKGRTFDEIARDLNVNAQELQSYNRWLNEDRIPTDREYLITIPVPLNQVAFVRQKLALPARPEIAAIEPAFADDSGFPVLKKSDVQSPDGHNFYEINGLPGIEARPGDKGKSLAKAGKVRSPTFHRYNDILRDSPIIPGRIYYLARKNRKAATPFHTARVGDSWQSISQQYGVRLVSLLKYNRTISRNYPLQVGQVLWLTKKRPKKQPVEIITPKPNDGTVTDTPIASAPTQPTPSTQTSAAIPQNASGRKKYTPVLVEKQETNVPTETAIPETAVAITKSAPVVVSPPVTVPSQNDRVVIITQNTEESTFKSVEEPKSAPDRSSNTTYSKPKERIQKTPVSTANAYHTVTSGETYFSIARKYSLSFKELMAMNGQASANKLVTGQKLIVKQGEQGFSPDENLTRPPVTAGQNTISEKPEITKSAPVPVKTQVSESVSTPKPSVVSPAEVSTTGSHTVEKGQTYFSISKMYDLSVRELLALNGMTDNNRLVVGQKLKVSKQSVESANIQPGSSDRTVNHTVASGETLFRISQTYQVTVEDIQKLNNLSGNNVHVGQKLKIPQHN